MGKASNSIYQETTSQFCIVGNADSTASSIGSALVPEWMVMCTQTETDFVSVGREEMEREVQKRRKGGCVNLARISFQEETASGSVSLPSMKGTLRS